MTTTTTLTRTDLAALPHSFFKAVDDKDIDTVAAHFAQDATLTVHTAHVTFTGVDAIRTMFAGFIDNTKTMLHEIQNVVVEEGLGKVATEQRYTGELLDGTKNDMHNCNVFHVGAEGKFERVVIWMSGTNPLN